jgi:hypothetical protein
MNSFVTAPGLDALLESAPAKWRPSSARAHDALKTRVNTAAWQLFSRLLDVLRISTESNVVRPSHIYNLMRLATMLGMPLRDDPMSRQILKNDLPRIMHGGGAGATTLPIAYFDPAGAARMGGGGCGCSDNKIDDQGQGGGGTRTSKRSSSPTGATGPTGPTGSSSPTGRRGDMEVITDAGVASMLAEYRSRITSSTLRVGEGSRALVKRILSKNLVDMMKASKSSAAFTKTTATWRLRL